MNVEIKLFKRTGTYEKDGKEKQFTNFYIGVNDQLIPVEVKYFPNKKLGDRDPGYQGRVGALSVVAELLSPLPTKDNTEKVNPKNFPCPKCLKKMEVEDQDGSDYILVCTDCNITAELNADNGEVTYYDSDRQEIPF